MHKITAFADQVFGLGDFRFSKTIYNFSDRQDIRLAVGTRGHFDERSAIRWVRRVLLAGKSLGCIPEWPSAAGGTWLARYARTVQC